MDDFSPIPLAPSLDLPEIPFEEEALEKDKEVAEIYFDKNWSKLEQIIGEEIQTLSHPADANLIASEYKIEDLSNKKAKAALQRVIERIGNAVSAVESTERTGAK